MAIQSSIIKLRGSIDDLTFMATKDGYQARKKVKPVSKETIATDPQYARMRENMSEFGRALTASKLIRLAGVDALADCCEKRIGRRLTKALMTMLISDPISERGKRNLMNGDATLMKGFSFNQAAIWTSIFKQPFSTGIDRINGKLVVDIPSFIPASKVFAPQGSTHCIIHSAALEINFETAQYITKLAESVPVKLNDRLANPAIQIEHEVTPNSTNPLFLLLGIRFFQEVNGSMYSILDKSFNAMSIVNADSV